MDRYDSLAFKKLDEWIAEAESSARENLLLTGQTAEYIYRQASRVQTLRDVRAQMCEIGKLINSGGSA